MRSSHAGHPAEPAPSRRTSRRRAVAIAGAVGLVAALVAPTAATASPASVPGAASASKAAPLLPTSMNGKAAIAALGDKLPEAARLNGRTPAALSQLLADDSTMWLNPEGHLFVQDVLEADHLAQAVDSGPAAASFSAVAPLSDTFVLHSRPSSTKKIYLDFDGVTLGPSMWSWAQKAYGGFDNDGDPTTFNTDERVAIQQVWAQVAEDYAPFDVDVTTEDPGAAALDRADVSDTEYGMRVAITDDQTARAQVAGCSISCGIVGLAFVGVFDRVKAEVTSEYAGPAWVFAHGVANDPGTIADIATHEVGHTLDLTHTNLSSSPLWGSIMNSSITGARITQWVTSTAGDQTAIITSSGLSLVADEFGNGPSVTSSRHYTSGLDGVISTPGDIDWYWVTSCRAGATISAQPADVAPNAALKLTLADASGTTITTNAPATSITNRQDASVTITDPNQPEFYFGVEGVGSGLDGADEAIPAGFNDYGSLGRYTLDVVGCDALGAKPSAPRSLVANTVGSTTSASWSAPSFSGGVGTASLTYEVSVDDGPWTSVGTLRTATLPTGAGRHAVSVRAGNVVGAGAPATTVSAIVPQVLRAWTTPGPSAGSYRIWWTEKEFSGAPVTRVNLATPSSGSFFFNGGVSGGLTFNFTEGSTIQFSLRNRVGTGQVVPFVARLAPVAPGAVVNPTATPDKDTREVALSWGKPVDDGTGTTLAYQVALDDSLWLTLSAPSYVFTEVPAGDHVVRVRAVNEVGPGPATEIPVTMEASDTTGPVITPDVQGTLGSNGWYVGDVTVSFTVTDPESGVVSQSAGCDTAALTSDSASTAYTCSATNGVGLTSEEVVIVKRDATKPTLAPTASTALVVQGGSVTVQANPAADATSGIDATLTGCDAASTATAGVITVQCTATDMAGNVQTATVSYTVINAFLGFQSPLPRATLNAKSSISVRFTVGDLAGAQQSSSADVQVRLSTAPNGGGTVLNTQACPYSATVLAYTCSFKAPSTVLKGKNAPPYYLTVFQRVPNGTGTWFLLPNGTGVRNTNSEPIFFK